VLVSEARSVHGGLARISANTGVATGGIDDIIRLDDEGIGDSLLRVPLLQYSSTVQ
jgi:hypothetical protein